MTAYAPNAKTAAMLARALQLVGAVPYRVSGRWLFYRLLQEGYYSSKSDYKDKFNKATAQARHAFYNGWRPDTLADDTREAILHGFGWNDVPDWLNGITEHLSCSLDKWSHQSHYVELWFEARAMVQQFEHYTKHVTLRPMGGQPSIEYKWNTAKHLERMARRYCRPIVVLYFGDLDEAGGNIAETVERDVRTWCSAHFKFVRCGLTLAQVQAYGVPENPEKPGEYQWEALSDHGAEEIITGAIAPYLRPDAIQKIEAQEQQATTWARGQLSELAQTWKDGAA
jgi:hypothetical protein